MIGGCGAQARPPMLPTHVFLVDVSYTAVASGATAAACSSIASVLDSLQGEALLIAWLFEEAYTVLCAKACMHRGRCDVCCPYGGTRGFACRRGARARGRGHL